LFIPSAVFQYSSPWWSRWFKATHKALSFFPEHILVTNWKGENRQLNWECVSSLPDITSRLWFKKVSLSSSDGGVSFAGLTKKEVERIQRAFNRHWYTAKATSVHAFITQIDEQIAQKGYFRTSHWSAMQIKGIHLLVRSTLHIH
jgi:hypothetical protein